MPKLTYAIQQFDKSGLTRAPYLLCKGFVKAGWQVEILTTAIPENEPINSAWGQVPIHKINAFGKKQKLFKVAAKLLRRRRHHLVLSWIWDWHNFSLLLAKLLFGSPYAIVLDTYTHLAPWDVQGTFSKIRLELRYGLILRHADLILAETPLAFDHAQHYFPKPQILLAPPGLWAEEVEAVETKWEADTLFREPVILYTGRIIKRKNIHDLIEAFSQIADQFPEWQVEIRGPIVDEEYYQSLVEQIRNAQLEKRIHFRPSLSGEALYRRYRTTSIYVLPSSGEGIPTTIIEAMYFGGAIVAVDSGAVGYQLEGGCGLLFEGGDVGCLRGHLTTLMSSLKSREASMKQAKGRVNNTFQWNQYFEFIEVQFQNILSRRDR